MGLSIMGRTLIAFSIAAAFIESLVLYHQLEVSIWAAMLVGILGNALAATVGVPVVLASVYLSGSSDRSSMWWEIVNEDYGNDELEEDFYYWSKDTHDFVVLSLLCWVVLSWLEYQFAALVLGRTEEILQAVIVANVTTFLLFTGVVIVGSWWSSR